LKSLYTKLAFTLVALILILGGTFYALERYNVKQYHEELSQRLNASIAMYVVDAMPLIKNGEVQKNTLTELAQQAMVINPAAEIYLLDQHGNILGNGQTEANLERKKVAIAPLKALLSGSAKLPIKADDPKDRLQKKIFSVHPVVDKTSADKSLAGYLYVVLGGSQYDALATEVGRGYWQNMMSAAIALISLITIASGLLLFSVITKRLRNVSARVSKFANYELNASEKVAPALLGEFIEERDEIDQLNNAFTKMSNKIVEQFDHLEEEDKLRRELITNISHDLRTPLASMQGYIETLLLKDESLNAEERRKYLLIARKHTQRLNLLITDLFELTKLESGRIKPNKEHFTLLELIHDVVQEFQLEANKRQISIKIDLDKQDTMAFADISLIQRVLENLIKNALRFTPANGMITVGIEEKSEHVSIMVADNGFGIQKQDLPRIFDRFYRSKHGEESKADSTGLGLAIVKRILDLHESSIVVKSEIKQGTSFKFNLPNQKIAA